MAQIECSHCKKSFKSESGYRWHLTHLHPDIIPSNSQDEARLEADEMPDPQCPKKAATTESDVHESMWWEVEPLGTIPNSPAEASEFQQQLSQEVAELSKGLDLMSGNKTATERLKQEVANIKTSISSIQRRLSKSERMSEALANLVWHLDREQRPSTLRDFGVFGPTPEELEESRDEIRPAIGAKDARRFLHKPT